MLIATALLVGYAALQCADASVLVNIQPLNANGRKRGSDARVLTWYEKTNEVKVWSFVKNGIKETWEKVDIEGTTGFYLYVKNYFDKRLTMPTKRTGYTFKVRMDPNKKGDERQIFTTNGHKIYCFAGATYDDGRKYVLRYEKDVWASNVVCAPEMGNPEEEMRFESIRNAKFNGAEFFLVNRRYPNTKLQMLGTNANSIGFRGNIFNKMQLWQFEEDKATPGYYYIKPSTKLNYRLLGLKGDRNALKFYWSGKYDDQLWKPELIEDNLGKEWDYYALTNHRYKTRLMVHTNNDIGLQNPYLGRMAGGGTEQQFRLIPRFNAEDGGFQFIARHVGQPNDITETVTYSQGLTLSRGSEVSTSTSITTSLEASVGAGPFSATASMEISHEIGTVDTTGSEKTWSETVEISRTFPAGMDCTLYQRRVNYLSALKSDSLGQTPRDFRMVCKKEAQCPACNCEGGEDGGTGPVINANAVHIMLGRDVEGAVEERALGDGVIEEVVSADKKGTEEEGGMEKKEAAVDASGDGTLEGRALQEAKGVAEDQEGQEEEE